MLRALFPASHISELIDFPLGRNGVFMDFESTNLWPVRGAAVGAGSGATNGIAAGAGQIGVLGMSTGTTATGSAAILTSTDALFLGNGASEAAMNFRLPVLSDGTETYIARFGFMDTTTVDAVDGVYFEADIASSANWRICTSSNSTRTKTNTTTAIDTNFNTFRIKVNAEGTSASFFIDGVEVSGSPITTNIPTGAGRQTGIIAHIIKSLGVTARTLEYDWLLWDLMLNTART